MLATDVLGVVTTFSDVQHVVQRATGKGLVKRDVNIVDDSGAMVSAISFDTSAFTIFLLRMNKVKFLLQTRYVSRCGRKRLKTSMVLIIQF